MALELRDNHDDLLGSLSAAALATDQQIASSVFASLPDWYSTTRYLPLVLANDTLGVYEVVYVIAHATGVNTVVVQRGKEGTTPLDWSIGDTIRVAATIRDVAGAPLVYGAAGEVPSDLAVGMRHLIATEGIVREKTFSQGSIPTVRSAPDDRGTGLHDTVPSNPNKALRVKVFNAVRVTEGGGYVNYYWPGTGFTKTLGCIPYKIQWGASATAAKAAVVVQLNLVDDGLNGASIWFGYADTNPAGAGIPLSNTQVHFGIIVFGE